MLIQRRVSLAGALLSGVSAAALFGCRTETPRRPASAKPTIAGQTALPVPKPVPPEKPATPEQKEVDRLLEEGKQADANHDYAKSEARMLSALAKAQKIHDTERVVKILFSGGWWYNVHQRYGEAVKFHLAAQPLLEHMKRWDWLFKNETQLGYLYHTLSKDAEARRFASQALELALEKKQKDNILWALNNLDSLNASDLSEHILAYHERALKLKHQWGTPADEAFSYRNLGNVYLALNREDEAYRAFMLAQQEMEKASDVNGRRFHALLLHDIGKILLDWGSYDEANRYFRRAGQAYDDLMKQARSEGEYIKSPQDERLDQTLRVVILDSQAVISMQQSHIQDAEKFLDAAQQQAAALHYTDNDISRLNTRAMLRLQQNRFEEAGRLLDAAEKAPQYKTDHFWAGQTQGNQGLVALMRNDLASSRDHLMRAAALLEDHAGEPVDSLLASVYTPLGVALYRANRLPEAEAKLKAARKHFETISAQVADPSSLGRMYSFLHDPYGPLAAIYHRQHQADKALLELERGRGQGLARQAARNQVIAGSLLTADRERWRVQKERLLAAERRMNTTRMPAAQKARDQAQNALSALEADLCIRYPRFRTFVGHPPTAALLDTLTRQQPDTLFLEWARVDTNTMLLCALGQEKGRRFVSSYLLTAPQSTVDPLIQRWHEDIRLGYRLTLRPEDQDAIPLIDRKDALIQVEQEEPKLARDIERLLLEPAAKAGLLRPGRFQHLALVPDSRLLGVPFAALCDDNGKRLIDRFAVSCGLSLNLMQSTNPPRPSSMPLWYAAGPDVPRKAAALQGDPRLMSGKGDNMSPLIFTRDRMPQVVALFPGAKGRIGSEARLSVVREEMGSSQVMILATHGTANSYDGLRSCLYFTPDKPDHPESGQLLARDIAEMQLAARLAVLWACETGLGEAQGGEGQMGPVWAFHAAGCPAVTAALWQVREDAAAHLMLPFLANLKAGQPKDKALQAAMQQVRKIKGFESPFWWAGFQVYGDAASLPFTR